MPVLKQNVCKSFFDSVSNDSNSNIMIIMFINIPWLGQSSTSGDHCRLRTFHDERFLTSNYLAD